MSFFKYISALTIICASSCNLWSANDDQGELQSSRLFKQKRDANTGDRPYGREGENLDVSSSMEREHQSLQDDLKWISNSYDMSRQALNSLKTDIQLRDKLKMGKRYLEVSFNTDPTFHLTMDKVNPFIIEALMPWSSEHFNKLVAPHGVTDQVYLLVLDEYRRLRMEDPKLLRIFQEMIPDYQLYRAMKSCAQREELPASFDETFSYGTGNYPLSFYWEQLDQADKEALVGTVAVDLSSLEQRLWGLDSALTNTITLIQKGNKGFGKEDHISSRHLTAIRQRVEAECVRPDSVSPWTAWPSDELIHLILTQEGMF